MTDALAAAESVRWAVSRLSTRLRAEQPGTAALTRLAASLLANLRHGGAATLTGLAETEGLAPQAALDEHVAAGNQWLAQALASVLTPAERRVLDVAAELLMAVSAHEDPSVRTRPARPRAGEPAAAPL